MAKSSTIKEAWVRAYRQWQLARAERLLAAAGDIYKKLGRANEAIEAYAMAVRSCDIEL